MQHELNLKEAQHEWHGSYVSYGIGFIVSLILTGASFLLVVTKSMSGHALMYTLAGLALTQAIFQLLFFLHLGQEDKPRWETLIFLFMLLVLLIVVVGTLWIMNDLDERVMNGMSM